MPRIPKFLRDLLPAPTPKPMRPHDPKDTGESAPKGWIPIKPPAANMTDYGVVDFAIGNRVVSSHGDGAGDVKATGTSAKGPGRANPSKQVLSPKEEASLPTVPSGAQGTVSAVMGRYLIITLDGDLGTWEFWKGDWHNMTPPDPSLRYWGERIIINAADLHPEKKANKSMKITAEDLYPANVVVDTDDLFERLAGKKTLERLLKTNPDDAAAIQMLADGDPTNNHDWLEGMYKWMKSGLSAYQVINLAHDLDRYLPALKEQGKGQNPQQYKLPTEAQEAIDALKSKRVKPRLRKQDAKYDIVHEAKGLKIYRADNKEASCVLGSDSDWCSAKWAQDWWENRTKMFGGNTVYIARFDDGRAYMLRVDSNDEIRTGFDKRDKNVHASGDAGYKTVVKALEELGITEGRGEDDGDNDDDNDDDYEEEVETLYGVLRPDGRDFLNATDLHSPEDVKEWVQENKPELLEEGYTISSGAFGSDSGFLGGWETVEEVEPQPLVEAYYISLFDNDSIIAAAKMLKGGTEKETSIQGHLNTDAADYKLTGYRIWKGYVPAWQVENQESDDWEFDTDSLTTVKEVKPSAAAKKPVTVFVLRKGNEILSASTKQKEIEKIQKDSEHAKHGGVQIVQYQMTAGQWAALGFQGNEQLKAFEEKVVRDYPVQDATRYIVLDPYDGLVFSGDNLEEAKKQYDERVERNKHYDQAKEVATQLIEVVGPGDVPSYEGRQLWETAKTKKVIEQDVPNATGQESLKLPVDKKQRQPPSLGRPTHDDSYLQKNLEMLNALPLGAKVNIKTSYGWGLPVTYTKQEHRGQPAWIGPYGGTRVEDMANVAVYGIEVVDYGHKQHELPLKGVEERLSADPARAVEQLRALDTGRVVVTSNGIHTQYYVKQQSGYWQQSNSSGEPYADGRSVGSDRFSPGSAEIMPKTASIRIGYKDIMERIIVTAFDITAGPERLQVLKEKNPGLEYVLDQLASYDFNGYVDKHNTESVQLVHMQAPVNINTWKHEKVWKFGQDKKYAGAVHQADRLLLRRTGFQRYEGKYNGKQVWIGSIDEVQHGSFPGNRRQKRERKWHVKVDGMPAGTGRTFLEARAMALDACMSTHTAARIDFVDDMNLRGQLDMDDVKEGDRVRFNADAENVKPGTIGEVVAIDADGPMLRVRAVGTQSANDIIRAVDIVVDISPDSVELLVDGRDPRLSSNRIRQAAPTDSMSPKDLSHWMSDVNTVTFISARQTGGGKSDTKMHHRDLFNDLRQLVPQQNIRQTRGQWFSKTTGEDRPEPSYAVRGLTFEQALELSKKYDQEGFIFKGPSGAVLMYEGYRPEDSQATITVPLKDGKPLFGSDALLTKAKQPKDVRRGPPPKDSHYVNSRSFSFQVPFDFSNEDRRQPWSGQQEVTRNEVERMYEPQKSPKIPTPGPEQVQEPAR